MVIHYTIVVLISLSKIRQVLETNSILFLVNP